MREEFIPRYIADDGSTFYTKELCEQYEANCALMIKDVLPELVFECDLVPIPFYMKRIDLVKLDIFLKYEWIKINSKDDYDKLIKFLSEKKSNSRLYKNLYEPSKYPEILTIEYSTPKRLMSSKSYTYTGKFSYYNEFLSTVNLYQEEMEKFL